MLRDTDVMDDWMAVKKVGWSLHYVVLYNVILIKYFYILLYEYNFLSLVAAFYLLIQDLT